MRKPKIMTRPPLNNRLDFVKQYSNNYGLYQEQDARYLSVPRISSLDTAFWIHDWTAFEKVITAKER